MFGSGHSSDLALRVTTLLISNEEKNDIMQIVRYLEEPGLLIKGVSETIQNKIKEQKRRFLSMLLGIVRYGIAIVY